MHIFRDGKKILTILRILKDYISKTKNWINISFRTLCNFLDQNKNLLFLRSGEGWGGLSRVHCGRVEPIVTWHLPSAMWSPSVIALFTLFICNFSLFFWYEWIKYVSNNTFTHKMSAVSMKYSWNLQMYFLNTEKCSQIVYTKNCEAHLLWSVMWRSSVIHHFHEY